jgi:hypothetical protein
LRVQTDEAAAAVSILGAPSFTLEGELFLRMTEDAVLAWANRGLGVPRLRL